MASRTTFVIVQKKQNPRKVIQVMTSEFDSTTKEHSIVTWCEVVF
jgi:hypothetical protein